MAGKIKNLGLVVSFIIFSKAAYCQNITQKDLLGTWEINGIRSTHSGFRVILTFENHSRFREELNGKLIAYSFYKIVSDANKSALVFLSDDTSIQKEFLHPLKLYGDTLEIHHFNFPYNEAYGLQKRDSIYFIRRK